MLTLAIPGPSWAHRLGAGRKLGALSIAMILLLQVTSLPALGLALAGIASLYASLGPRAWRPGLEGLRPLIWLAVLVVAFHAVFADFATGAAMALRIFVMVGLANFITLTTPMAEMIAVVTRVAAPLRHLGLDPRALALSMALFLRYIPVLRARAAALALAWRARSQRRTGVRIIVPLVLTALDDADQLADALRARGGLAPQTNETPPQPLVKGAKE